MIKIKRSFRYIMGKNANKIQYVNSKAPAINMQIKMLDNEHKKKKNVTVRDDNS